MRHVLTTTHYRSTVLSKLKSKGTSFETLVTEYLCSEGLDAYRQPLSGVNDKGDIHIHGWPDFVIEAKNHKRMELSQWITEAETEKVNANRELGIVVHKRLRKGQPQDQYVTMTLDTFARLVRYAQGSVE